MFLTRLRKTIDWSILLALVPLIVMSLSALYSFSSGGENFFFRQGVWFGISLLVLSLLSLGDFSFLKKTPNVIFLYSLSLVLLILVSLFGAKVNGARSWIHIAGFSFQPADLVKMSLIVLFSKYLAKRHLAIKFFVHITITFLYFFVPFLFVFSQPDFGSALILLVVWFGMVMLSGLSKKHFFLFLVLGILTSLGLWFFVLHDYQKERIVSFLHPLSDTRGAGYNAYQSMIAVGSGKIIGKGVGYGTQSRLSFLPEHETDFIFAAIAEEWGFLGVLVMLGSLAFIIFRLLSYVEHFNGNFERLLTIGFILYLSAHIVVNVGMNIGLMPVTGVPLPFVSYGGSHLLVEFLLLGLIFSFRAEARSSYPYNQQYADEYLDAF